MGVYFFGMIIATIVGKKEEVMNNEPEEIYLIMPSDDQTFGKTNEVAIHWGRKKCRKHDVRYIHESQLKEKEQEIEGLKKEADTLRYCLNKDSDYGAKMLVISTKTRVELKEMYMEAIREFSQYKDGDAYALGCIDTLKDTFNEEKYLK